ncbi:chromosome partitioning protein ParB [Anabaena catenula]|uniref:Chromosome partitioning protein ParB n=1 Tax=Anabaena catenula FACHB-362 TaxID=2692877 RepID=A0ABR8J8P1_9NOST|nr:chromosome partitioning protein ParB [Anabaena catenula]MBD2694042.1 chromosome partitioning protein ParB [Anabaena catenula FACHB-362]
MINFSLVDVKSVTSNVLRSNFNESDLENLADSIIETGGIIKPLVVKLTAPESYTVVNGDFEYYAAVRAREKNPRKCEMVNAFIISPKVEDLIKKQVATIEVPVTVTQPSTKSETTNLDSSRLTNLELRFEKQLNELKSELTQERQRIDEKFKQFERIIPQELNPLSLLNTLEKDELAIRLQRSRIPGAEKISKAIVDARSKKPKQVFEDYRDVVKSVKGLGEKTLLTIIDEWCRN